MSQGVAILRRSMWGELRAEADAEGVVVVVCCLPAEAQPGLYWPRVDGFYILVHDELDEPERSIVLAHELEHHRRGGGADAAGMPPMWAACVARDEEAVDKAVARRAVPLNDLREILAACEAFDHGVTAAEIAGDYGVTRDVAARAMRLVLEDEERSSA
jgi:hypothetical protein